MARYLSNINLSNNQLQNAALHPTATEPSNPVEGQVYYNTSSDKLFIYNGSAWVDISGDITSITAGTGLTGTGTTGDITLNVGAGDGITVNADDVALNVETTQFEFVTGKLTISNGAIGSDELAASGVTADTYGSSTAIPVIAIDTDGRITSATTAAISTTLTLAADSGTGDGVNLATDTLTISGTANEIETSLSGDTITIALPDNVTIGNNLTVTGDLTVSGTTTTINTETINLADNIITLNSNYAGASPSENAGIEVERGTADNNVSILWDESIDRWTFTNDGVTFNNILLTSDIATTVTDREYAASIGDGVTTAYTVIHNLGTRDVMVQLYDNSSFDTVYADITRTLTDRITVTFATAPTTNDIRVLITKIG
jgi:hypothetical protein